MKACIFSSRVCSVHNYRVVLVIQKYRICDPVNGNCIVFMILALCVIVNAKLDMIQWSQTGKKINLPIDMFSYWLDWAEMSAKCLSQKFGAQ